MCRLIFLPSTEADAIVPEGRKEAKQDRGLCAVILLRFLYDYRFAVCLFLQGCDAFLERLNLALGVGLFLAFHFDDLGRSLRHEFLVAEFFQN